MTAAIDVRARAREQAGADYWGQRLTAAVVMVWAACFGIGFQRGLAIMVFLSLAATAAGLLWPRIGLLGLGMAVTLDPIARTHLSVQIYRFNTLNYLMVLVMFLFLPIVLKKGDIHLRLLSGLVILLGVGLAVSPSPELGVQHWLNLLAPFGMFVYFVRAAGDGRTWYWTGVLNGMLSAAGTLAFFLLVSDRGNYNVWSYFPLTGLISICLSFPFAGSRRWEGMVLSGLAAVNTAWVFLSSSRGSLLIALACVAFLILRTPGLSRRAMTVTCGVLVALAICASFSDLRESALIRVEKLFDRSLTIEEATSRRSILISEGWHIFRENPLGVGTGGYALTAAPGAAQAFEGNAMQAHSAWVKTLAENGVPGTALLAAFVASYAFAGWRRRSLDAVLMGGLTTAVLALAYLSTEFAIKGLWFLAMGVSILLHHQPYARRSTV